LKNEDAASKKQLLEQCIKDVVVKYGGLNEDTNIEGYSSYEDSNAEINTPGDSEDDDIRGNKYKVSVPVINDQTDWKKFNWVVGIRFRTRAAFKEAVRKYVVSNGRNLYVSVSDISSVWRMVGK
jgi:hypothetical protein